MIFRYVQHFAKMNSEHCQASEVELSVKTFNDSKPMKLLSQKGPPGVFLGVPNTHLVSLSYIYERGEGSRSRSVA